MFERFARPARDIVVRSQELARAERAGEIHSGHLLVSAFDVDDQVAAFVLAGVGVERADVLAAARRRDADGPPTDDAAALAELGIDLYEVRRRAEETFGPGALDRTGRRRGRRPLGRLPFTPDAKKALELSLREALRLRHHHIAAAHVVLGLLHDGTALRGVLDDGPARLAAARILVDEQLSPPWRRTG